MSRKTQSHKPLIYKAFWHIFTKNSIFLNVDIVKYLQICDTKTIVMEETNQQSLYVCFATLSEWHCR